MEGRVCGNCGEKADAMRAWGRGPYGGIAIRRRCARALDSVAAVGGSWNDKKSAAMDAGSEAYMAGQPCFPPTENLEDRQLN